ncbi:hypothetical protein LCGC14_0735310 [marine sediment metagenome]|uniref:Uncharacterized protein n=1 Tax=marine sediment metagenome TaxID=412755 RepID=A0A0F9STD3_9ZZZZ
MIRFSYDAPRQVDSFLYWLFFTWGLDSTGWRGFRILGLVIEYHE